MIELLYERYTDFSIATPSKIPAFLATEFISVGRTPQQARLSKLHISGHLDVSRETSINLNTLERDFKALLDCTSMSNLHVDIVFRAELGHLYLDVEALPVVAHRMHATWQKVGPWIQEAEKRCSRALFCSAHAG